MKKYIVILILGIFISLSAIENPYETLPDSEKITALVNYFVKKELEVAKPQLPTKPSKPYVKPNPDLVKGKFEKTSDFKKRVAKARSDREKYIKNLEEDYKNKVLAYNKEVKRLIDAYNKKVSSIKKNIDKITANAMGKAYGIVYGKPMLKAKDYDADNEILYAKLTSSNNNYDKDIALKVPLSIAENFYNTIGSITPKVIFDYKNNQMALKDIQVPYKKKSYSAMLTEGDYTSSIVKVAINSRNLNLVEADMLNSNFKADKSDFDLGKIDYAKSKVAKLSTKDLKELNRQRLANLNETIDDLPSLLQKAKPAKKNQKAYAIIFGVEDYLLEPNVAYSRNSAMMFMSYANKLLGVPDENIWAFVGDRKTGAGFIKSQWNDFLYSIEKDATVYFYYSGHGVPGSDGEAYILPSDTDAETATNDKTFMLRNIYKNLSDSQAQKIVAFVDSCFSGKADGNKLLFDGVAPVLKVKKTNFDSSKMTIFTAGSNEDFSNQYKEKKHRLFSYFLMKGLAQGKTSTKELYAYVKKNVANKSRKLGTAYKQVPQLLGKRSGIVR